MIIYRLTMSGFKSNDIFLLHNIIIYRYRMCIKHIKHESYYYDTHRVKGCHGWTGLTGTE